MLILASLGTVIELRDTHNLRICSDTLSKKSVLVVQVEDSGSEIDFERAMR